MKQPFLHWSLIRKAARVTVQGLVVSLGSVQLTVGRRPLVTRPRKAAKGVTA